MAERQGTTSDAYVVAGSANAWTAETAAKGGVGTQRPLEVATIDPPAAVSDALGLKPGERVVVRSRLMLLDDQPVEIASSYYPAGIAAGTPLAGRAKIRGGAIAALTELGHAPVEVAEQVTARLPDSEETDLLGVDDNEPLLILIRVNRDSAGQAVEFAVNRMVARLSAPIAYRMRTAAT